MRYNLNSNLHDKLGNYLDHNTEYFRLYLKLIEENKLTQIKHIDGYQIHHIIPRSFTKIDKLPTDNSKSNLVNLKIRDHFIAHYLLWKCSKREYKTVSAWAYIMMCNLCKAKIEQDPYYNSELYEKAINEKPTNVLRDPDYYNERFKKEGCKIILLDRDDNKMTWKCCVCGTEWKSCSTNHFLTSKKPLCPKCKLHYGKDEVFVSVFCILNNKAYWSVYKIAPPSMGTITDTFIRTQVLRIRNVTKLKILKIFSTKEFSYEDIIFYYKNKFGEDRCGLNRKVIKWPFDLILCNALNFLIKHNLMSFTTLNNIYKDNAAGKLKKCNNHYKLDQPKPFYRPNEIAVVCDDLDIYGYLSELAQKQNCTTSNIRNTLLNLKKQGYDVNFFNPESTVCEFIKEVYYRYDWEDVLTRLAIVFRKMDELNPERKKEHHPELFGQEELSGVTVHHDTYPASR